MAGWPQQQRRAGHMQLQPHRAMPACYQPASLPPAPCQTRQTRGRRRGGASPGCLGWAAPRAARRSCPRRALRAQGQGHITCAGVGGASAASQCTHPHNNDAPEACQGPTTEHHPINLRPHPAAAPQTGPPAHPGRWRRQRGRRRPGAPRRWRRWRERRQGMASCVFLVSRGRRVGGARCEGSCGRTSRMTWATTRWESLGSCPQSWSSGGS